MPASELALPNTRKLFIPGGVVLLDEEDYWRLKGRRVFTAKGYAFTGRNTPLHEIIMQSLKEVDHTLPYSASSLG